MQRIKHEVPKRSYSGEQWRTNTTNKKYLAIDFKNRCAYCDDLDAYNGGYRNYHVEHFAPKEKFPNLKYTYDNLLYACPYCNNSKSDKWPSNEAGVNVVGDCGFIDPCCEEYYDNLYREDDGRIAYNTNLGKYIYNELNLGLKRHQILYRQVELNDLIGKLEKKIERLKEEGEDVEQYEQALIVLLKEFRICVNTVNEES